MFVHSSGVCKHCLGTDRKDARGILGGLVGGGGGLAGNRAVVRMPRAGCSVVKACRCLWLAQCGVCFKEEGPGQSPFRGLPDVWAEEAESLSKHIPRDSAPPSPLPLDSERLADLREQRDGGAAQTNGALPSDQGAAGIKSGLWALLLGGATGIWTGEDLVQSLLQAQRGSATAGKQREREEEANEKTNF